MNLKEPFTVKVSFVEAIAWKILTIAILASLVISFTQSNFFIVSILLSIPVALYDILTLRMHMFFVKYSIYFFICWIFAIILSIVGLIPVFYHYTAIDYFVIFYVVVSTIFLIVNDKMGLGDIAILPFVVVNPFISAVALTIIGILSVINKIEKIVNVLPFFGVFIIVSLLAMLLLPVTYPNICSVTIINDLNEIVNCSKIIFS